MKVYDIVVEQCDKKDNGPKLHVFYLETLDNFISTQVVPVLQAAPNDQVLETFVKVWDNYTMFAMLLDKMFDFLNSNFLKIQKLQALNLSAFKKFKEIVLPNIKQRLQTSLLD